MSFKLVDDLLACAADLNELEKTLRKVFKACIDANIILSKKKFAIGRSVKFAGHIISADGCKPDPEKVDALREYPSPTNITELRGFMGLANQLCSFMPDLAHQTENMRQLLRKKNAFLWTDDIEKEFQKVKGILCSDLVCKPYDPNLDIEIYTDASRIGLGYILCQTDKSGHRKLIRCGSRCLSDCEKRYAMVELEALAIVFAVQKCNYFLAGNSNNSIRIVTDHKPLLGVFAKDIRDIENPRLQRLKEKVMHVPFKLDWIPGKDQCIADALSRTPFSPAPSMI